jgi:hypothetical protein
MEKKAQHDLLHFSFEIVCEFMTDPEPDDEGPEVFNDLIEIWFDFDRSIKEQIEEYFLNDKVYGMIPVIKKISNVVHYDEWGAEMSKGHPVNKLLKEKIKEFLA